MSHTAPSCGRKREEMMQPGGKQGRTSTAKEMEEPALNAWPTEKALVLCCFQCEATNLFQVCTWRQPPSSICTWKQQHFSICTWRQPHILCGGIASTIPKGRRSTSQADTWPVGQGRKEQVCSVLLDSEALSEGAQAHDTGLRRLDRLCAAFH